MTVDLFYASAHAAIQEFVTRAGTVGVLVIALLGVTHTFWPWQSALTRHTEKTYN